ncbi:hypothetical protein GIB67_029038 [Kingdonia uniflora]|uniref:Uncharacterized protein n=1 Tax=Kingdonia uniflora TaxID=39325 RepID=A0A7J7N6B4_9MAGN|nr:hypothetical protein GIB67_029038 [Kingdonia uniflora]
MIGQYTIPTNPPPTYIDGVPDDFIERLQENDWIDTIAFSFQGFTESNYTLFWRTVTLGYRIPKFFYAVNTDEVGPARYIDRFHVSHPPQAGHHPVDAGVPVPDDVTRIISALSIPNNMPESSRTKLMWGRKRACVTFCITYILSCITKHSPQYKILMVGGITTSLLFSAFESWLVAERNKVKYLALPLNECFPVMMPLIFNLFLLRGFEQQWLFVTFSKAIFFGNGLVAIIVGLFGNMLADTLGFGPITLFDAATCFLAIGMAIIMSSWSENFGDPSESKDLFTQFKGAAVGIASGKSLTTF